MWETTTPITWSQAREFSVLRVLEHQDPNSKYFSKISLPEIKPCAHKANRWATEDVLHLRLKKRGANTKSVQIKYKDLVKPS